MDNAAAMLARPGGRKWRAQCTNETGAADLVPKRELFLLTHWRDNIHVPEWAAFRSLKKV
jgi:hypothetical protein